MAEKTKPKSKPVTKKNEEIPLINPIQTTPTQNIPLQIKEITKEELIINAVKALLIDIDGLYIGGNAQRSKEALEILISK